MTDKSNGTTRHATVDMTPRLGRTPPPIKLDETGRQDRSYTIAQVTELLSEAIACIEDAQLLVTGLPIGSTHTLLKHGRHFLESATREYCDDEKREERVAERAKRPKPRKPTKPASRTPKRIYEDWTCRKCGTNTTYWRRRDTQGELTLCLDCYYRMETERRRKLKDKSVDESIDPSLCIPGEIVWRSNEIPIVIIDNDEEIDAVHRRMDVSALLT